MSNALSLFKSKTFQKAGIDNVTVDDNFQKYALKVNNSISSYPQDLKKALENYQQNLSKFLKSSCEVSNLFIKYHCQASDDIAEEEVYSETPTEYKTILTEYNHLLTTLKNEKLELLKKSLLMIYSMKN